MCALTGVKWKCDVFTSHKSNGQRGLVSYLPNRFGKGQNNIRQHINYRAKIFEEANFIGSKTSKIYRKHVIENTNGRNRKISKDGIKKKCCRKTKQCLFYLDKIPITYNAKTVFLYLFLRYFASLVLVVGPFRLIFCAFDFFLRFVVRALIFCHFERATYRKATYRKGMKHRKKEYEPAPGRAGRV